MSEPPAHDFDPAESPIAQEARETARTLATARADAYRTSDPQLWIEQYDVTMERLVGLLEEGSPDALIYAASLIDALAQLPAVVARSAQEVASIEGKSMEQALARQHNLSAPMAERLRNAFDPQQLLSLAFRGIEEEGWTF